MTGQCYNYANKTKIDCYAGWARLFPRLVNKSTGELDRQEKDLEKLEERNFCSKCLEIMEA